MTSRETQCVTTGHGHREMTRSLRTDTSPPRHTPRSVAAALAGGGSSRSPPARPSDDHVRARGARVAPLQPVALHQPAMHFERQTEFGEILGAGEAEAAASFDPVQSAADGVGVTIKPRGG